MAFNCGSSPEPVVEPVKIERQHSAFGDAYSVKSRSAGSYNTPLSGRFHDEPEADYDDGATELYRCIENKDWDGALSRLEQSPIEAKTWVYRREYSSGNRTRWRLLPLHAVCIFRAPLALIEALIEVYRDGPQMKDDQGMLPVHLACRNGASKGVVLTLLSSFPDSIFLRDRKGRSINDLVESSNSANKEAVLFAIKRFENDLVKAPKIDASSHLEVPTPAKVTVNEVDYDHRTILFRLILKKDWKAAIARAENFPEEAATFIVTKGFNGNLRFLPLHKACVLQPPTSIIEALLKAYPEGSEDKDQDGWLPVHCACFYGAGEKVISTLLEAYPKGAQSKDDEGRLPLHYGCLKGASQEVVDVLLASFSKGALSKDDEGRLPIHHACSKSAPDGVIEALLKASPKGAQSKDDQGRLPLHHSCRKNASERVVRTLLRVYPRAAQIKDDQDKLPVHYACQNGMSADVVSVLLTTYPESVNVQNGFGYTPLAEAKLAKGPNKEALVDALDMFKKEQDKKKVSDGVTTSVDTKMSVLEEKILQLEKTLAKVSDFGKEIKIDLRKGKEPEDVLEKLAEKLIELGGARTPLKSRNASPGRGLFGLGKHNHKNKAANKAVKSK